jgi:adenylyltransferase/sulfurtransferase
VFGAVSRFEGQVAVFNAHVPGVGYSANYRDLFKKPPRDGEVLNCAEAGVLGVLPGIIGTLQANEVIKLLTGIGKPLINQVLTYNALYNSFYTLTLMGSKDYLADMPADIEAFRQTDYGWECGIDFGAAEIDVGTFELKLGMPGIAIVDVRNAGEEPEDAGFECRKFPLPLIKAGEEEIDEDEVVFFCQSGKRSLEAVRIMENRYGAGKKVYSLRGGLLAYLENKTLQQI